MRLQPPKPGIPMEPRVVLELDTGDSHGLKKSVYDNAVKNNILDATVKVALGMDVKVLSVDGVPVDKPAGKPVKKPTTK